MRVQRDGRKIEDEGGGEEERDCEGGISRVVMPDD